MASISHLPMPGQEKMVSVSTAPRAAAPVARRLHVSPGGGQMSFTKLVRARRSLRSATIALTVLGAILMVSAVGGLRWALAQSELRSANAARGRDVIALAHAVARSASVAQTLAGVFLMSRDPDVRASYERAVDSGRAQLDALAASVGDDAEGAARAGDIRERFEHWAEDSTAFVDAEPRGREALPGSALFAPERLSEEQRRQIPALLERMESVQRAVDAFIASEASAVTAGERAVVSLGRAVDRGAVVATIVMMLVAAAALVIFMRRVARPLAELTASALAIAGGDLRRRVALEGEDEIGSLAASFNAMAEQLDRQVRQDEALRHARELMHAALLPVLLLLLLLLLMVMLVLVLVLQLTGGADLVVELAERLRGEHADVAVLREP